MKRKLVECSLITLLIFSILLSACQPAPAPESVPPKPTNPPPTATTEIEQVTEEETFLEENGFIVVSTKDERFPVVALGSDGQALAPLLAEGDDLSPENVQGAVFAGGNDSGEDIVVNLGEDGLPAEMQIGDYVVLFSDYTESTVNLALFKGDEMINIVAGVALDSDLLLRYRELIASADQASSSTGQLLSLVPPSAESEVGRMFELVGLMINLTACTASLAFPPSVWLVINSCGSAFLSAVTLFTGEDLDLYHGDDMPLIVVDAVGCLAKEPIACVSMIIDGIAILADKFDETQEANDEVYEEVREDMGCPSWFVYAETEWNGCASCGTSPDLDKAWELALAYCEKECGEECSIMREPRCDVDY